MENILLDLVIIAILLFILVKIKTLVGSIETLAHFMLNIYNNSITIPDPDINETPAIDSVTEELPESSVNPPAIDREPGDEVEETSVTEDQATEDARGIEQTQGAELSDISATKKQKTRKPMSLKQEETLANGRLKRKKNILNKKGTKND